jgi:hypothetical protein
MLEIVYFFHHRKCGYDVPGMILSRNLMGAMRLDHGKNMAIHVSTCLSYNFNALTTVVWKLWS